MKVEVLDREPLRYAYLRHIGPYPEIGAAFGRMCGVAGAGELLSHPDALFVGIYLDDPMSTPPPELRSDAGVTLVEGASAPEGLEEGVIAGGRHAKGVHKGSYAKMSEGWMATYDAIRAAGLKPRPSPPFEVYLSDMETTPEDELITEIYVPIE